MNYPSVKFSLTKPEFTATSYGFKDGQRNNLTFYNLNLKNILGNLYFQYDYFYLNLLAISNNLNGSGDVAGDEAYVNINISGFDFCNGKSNAVLGTYQFDVTKPVLKLFDATNAVIVKKSPENFNMVVYYTRVTDNGFSTNGYNNVTLLFELTPCSSLE